MAGVFHQPFLYTANNNLVLYFGQKGGIRLFICPNLSKK